MKKHRIKILFIHLFIYLFILFAMVIPFPPLLDWNNKSMKKKQANKQTHTKINI